MKNLTTLALILTALIAAPVSYAETETTPMRDKANKVERFQNRVDHMIGKLEGLQTKVNDRDMDETKKQEMLTKISTAIDTLETQKGALNEDATREEAQAAVQAVRDVMKDFKRGFRHVRGGMWVNRLEKRMERANTIAGRVEDRIANMQADGRDTTALESTLLTFRAGLVSSQSKIDEAKALYDANDPETFSEGKETVKEAHDKLKETFKNFREAVRSSRGR